MNRNCLTALAALSAFVLSAAPLAALPGLSPVWERYFNHNQPFDAANPDHAPGADPDGDGWDNVEESTAGTSPWDPNPPGILLPVIEYYPEVSAFSIQWGPTQIGKRYRLMMSTTLEAGSWSMVGDSVPGHGGSERVNLTLTDTAGVPQPRVFFRVVVDDIPSSSAGITGRTQWDDHMLATHPEIPDDIDPVPPDPNEDPDDDGDGHPNSIDALKSDPNINWRKAPEAFYLWIPVDDSTRLTGIDINDKGQLLFEAPRPDLPDLPTQPVAKIWDPAKPAASRWSDVFFNPSPSFKINAFNYSGPEPEFFVHDVPFPFPQGDLIGYDIHFQFRYLGDDGSILANAMFNFSERRDLETSVMAGDSEDLVFLWKGSNRTSPVLFGQGRGSSEDRSRETRNGAVGFFTDRSGTAPVVKALVLDQDRVYSGGIPVSDLFLKVMSTNSTSISSYLLKHDREMSPAPVGAAYEGATHGGRFLLQHNRQLNGPPYWESTFVAASATGAAPVVNVPRHSYDTLVDLPTGAWALGNASAPLRIAREGQSFTSTSVSGILQMDRQGVGIGNGSNGLHIWRNGRWSTLKQATRDPLFRDEIKPRKITASGFIWASNESGTTQGVLVPAKIVPEDHMAGVVGDSIKSILPVSKVDHFVTPKKTQEINQDYVEMKASGIDAATFNNLYTWEGGESGSSPEKRKVSRATAGLTELKLKTKDGKIAAQTNVWVVWTTYVRQGGVNALYDIDIDPANSIYYIPNSLIGAKRFIFTILPESIITNDERPDLDEKPEKSVPGDQKPHLLMLDEKADSANFKWDLSRKVQITFSNPNLLANNRFHEKFRHLLPTEPKRNHVLAFPPNPIEGNDDPDTESQSTNPYQEDTSPDKKHLVGQMSSYDAPSIPMSNAGGIHNELLKITYDFREFSRLHLWDGERKEGAFWFRISDYVPWHHKMSSIYTVPPSKWTDSGSSSGNGASGAPGS